MENLDELLWILDGQTWSLMAQTNILGLLPAVETLVCDQPQSWKALLQGLAYLSCPEPQQTPKVLVGVINLELV